MIESTGEMMKKIEIVYRDEQNEAVIRKLNHVVEDIFYGYAEVETCYANRLTDTYADINYAITPDEMPFVPAHIQNVINTGYRMLSFDAISKIAE